MSAYLFLPLAFLKFWFIEAPSGMLAFFASFNKSLLHLLSLPILFSTFFKPLKNEYREGLVGFSIGMGMLVKSSLILVDLLVFLLVFAFELIVLVGFVLLPFLSLAVLLDLKL